MIGVYLKMSHPSGASVTYPKAYSDIRYRKRHVVYHIKNFHIRHFEIHPDDWKAVEQLTEEVGGDRAANIAKYTDALGSLGDAASLRSFLDDLGLSNKQPNGISVLLNSGLTEGVVKAWKVMSDLPNSKRWARQSEPILKKLVEYPDKRVYLKMSRY